MRYRASLSSIYSSTTTKARSFRQISSTSSSVRVTAREVLAVRQYMKTPMALALLLFTAASCADSLAPSAATLDGSWSVQNEVPGSSEVWNLAVSGDTISGEGSWTGEACCSGTLTVSGNIVHDSVHVQVVFAGGPLGRANTYFFVGALASRTELVGTSTRLGAFPPIVEHLQKLKQ